jgi:hypothetical protein
MLDRLLKRDMVWDKTIRYRVAEKAAK